MPLLFVECLLIFYKTYTMPRQTGVLFKRKGRKIVYDVYCFIIKQGKNDMEKVKQTSEATKTSVILTKLKALACSPCFGLRVRKDQGRRKLPEWIVSFNL